MITLDDAAELIVMLYESGEDLMTAIEIVREIAIKMQYKTLGI